MYTTLLTVHSLFRWLVLLTLLASVIRATLGYVKQKPFSKGDNALRHWTATVAQTQLTIGVFLYLKSPIIQYFWGHFNEGIKHLDTAFFSLYHVGLMTISVLLVTIGSALAKRAPTDRKKYQTMLIWFVLALVIIFIAIPWPFSPFAHRPVFRTF